MCPETGRLRKMSSHAPAPPSVRRPRRPLTLRTKLIAGIVGLIVLLSAVMGVVTEVFLSKYLIGQLDARLNTIPVGNPGNGENAPPSGSDNGSGYRRFIFADCHPASTSAPGSATSTSRPTSTPAQKVAQPDGSLFARISDGVVTGSIRPTVVTCDPIPPAVASTLTALVPDSGIRTIALPGYGDFRVKAKQNRDGSVSISGASLLVVTETQTTLAVIMALVAAGAIVLGGVTVLIIVRRSVRPLERVAATARKVATLPLDKGDVDLAVRVATKDTDPRTEIGSVGAAINQMLNHVSSALTARQASETRVRQFVADASHELRTPLAAIRGYAELARRGEHEPHAVAHALNRVESESARMTTLVEDLLLLARLDSGRPLGKEELDLTVLAVDCVSDARVAGTDHKWQLDLPDQPVTLIGDAPRLHQVLANLLANARVHTPSGTTVVTAIRREPGGVVLTVADDGPGIPAALQPEIFGRFVRGGLLAVKGRGLDGARTRHRGSSHHSAPRDRHGGQRPWPNVRPGKASGRDRRVRRHTASGGCCERPVVAPTRLRRANPELLNDSTANRRFVFGVRKRVGGARRQLRDCAAVVGELTAVLDLATDR